MPITDSESLEVQLYRLLSEPIEAAKERASTAFDQEMEPFGNKLVLFGVGNMGRRVLACLRQDGIEPLALSDNQKDSWGKTIDGLPVLPPEEAVRRHGCEAAFVVTIYNGHHSFPDTRRQLLSLGCARVISVVPLRWKYHETFLPYFRDDLPHKVLLQVAAIREAFHVWSDEASRREFVAQVCWRLHGHFDVLGNPLLVREYFPEDLFQFTSDEFFVDVGAYDGDTVKEFIGIQGTGFRRVLAIEPDPENFRTLSDYLSNLPACVRGKIEAIPAAVGDRTCRLRFAAGEGVSSAVSSCGMIEVDCIRLDDLLREQRPTYIKMDIEGAEPEAIDGCRRVLCEDRPLLAACVYHAQDHLWRIPLAISRISPRYRFFLRCYMPECWDTVCYAVPAERALT